MFAEHRRDRDQSQGGCVYDHYLVVSIAIISAGINEYCLRVVYENIKFPTGDLRDLGMASLDAVGVGYV